MVDDEEAVRKALQRLLRSANMDVETYPSGVEFLDAMASRAHEPNAPQCVLLDLHMPGLSGFEVQARLAKSGSRLPVVVITGHDSPETRTRVLAGGAAAYLLKPIDDVALLDAIGTAIAHSKA